MVIMSDVVDFYLVCDGNNVWCYGLLYNLIISLEYLCVWFWIYFWLFLFPTFILLSLLILRLLCGIFSLQSAAAFAFWVPCVNFIYFWHVCLVTLNFISFDPNVYAFCLWWDLLQSLICVWFLLQSTSSSEMYVSSLIWNMEALLHCN